MLFFPLEPALSRSGLAALKKFSGRYRVNTGGSSGSSFFKILAGVDEAGRGPLAGPVVAAAVVLPIGLKLTGLNDSKKLTPLQRERLFAVISARACFGIGLSSAEEIDACGILQATNRAMLRAVENLKLSADCLLVDGRDRFSFPVPSISIVKGDACVRSIAAASIVAKVTRDHILRGYAKIFPQYGFAKHKGYGTELHLRVLKKFGACAIHRKTFAGVSG
jgi:ribonuclease HII